MSKTFQNLYQKQIDFQNMVIKNKPYDFDIENVPEDNIQGCSYHIQALISEVGEILAADKRWKNYRNNKIDMENKKEEIADCFIVLMNIAMYSGIKPEELEQIILDKIDENAKRVQSL